MAAIAVSTVTLFQIPLVLRDLIDGVIAGQPLEQPSLVMRLVFLGIDPESMNGYLWIAGILLVALTVTSEGFNFVRALLASQASERLARRLRDRLYDHLHHLPMSWHSRVETGDIVQRCTSDVETVKNFLANQLLELAKSCIMVLTVLPIMLSLDVKMAGVSLICVPVVGGLSIYFFKRIRASFKRVEEAEGRVTTVLQENLSGIRVVRAFGRHAHEMERFAEGNDEYRDRRYSFIRMLACFWPINDFLILFQLLLILVVGGWFVTRGELSLGTMLAFQASSGILLMPIMHLGRLLGDAGMASVALGRIREVLEQAQEHQVADEEETPAMHGPDSKIEGRISVAGLTFGYDPKRPVLKEVSFEVEPGEVLAILGPTGAGKTTLMQLILRLWDYQEGSIRVDGMELRELSRQQVRGWIGSVLQEPFLFSKTIGDNIRLGRTEAPESEVVEAARVACIDRTINGFDQGYSTLVGEKGVTLSGGQRQRVALARAILKDPPILILDDALSAVDMRTETMILDALRSRQHRHTTLVIAHRVSTLMQADRILVLEDGRITQNGSHEELIEAPGLYQRLWRLQSSIEEDLVIN